MSTNVKNGEAEVVRQVEHDLRAYIEQEVLKSKIGNGEVLADTEHWEKVGGKSWADLIRSDGSVNPDALRNFRRVFARHFVPDSPTSNFNPNNPFTKLLGSNRGQYHALKHGYRELRRHDALDLLKKYPCPTVGNPNIFEYKEYRYTRRWMRNIYFLNLFRQKLSDLLPGNFVALDIGAAYGGFASLLYQLRPGSHHILVDMPAPLLLSRYFLATQFPNARIAGPAELAGHETLTREFVESYDFILMPPAYYEKLEAGTLDLVTSFACLGELTRQYFDYYINAPAFRATQYFFTVNPVDSREMFSDVTTSVLDYPIHNPEGRIRFRVSPVFKHSYHPPKEKLAFMYKDKGFPAFFEYIGKVS